MPATLKRKFVVAVARPALLMLKPATKAVDVDPMFAPITIGIAASGGSVPC